MSSSRSRKEAARPRAPRWFVKYTPWGARRRVARFFPNERRARAFYKRLCRRFPPSEEQDIGRETVPVDIRAIVILKVASGKVALRIGRGRAFAIFYAHDALRDYGAFRQALLDQAGYELPKREKAGWRETLCRRRP